MLESGDHTITHSENRRSRLIVRMIGIMPQRRSGRDSTRATPASDSSLIVFYRSLKKWLVLASILSEISAVNSISKILIIAKI